MKNNGLLRFYLFFMFMSFALFSCENHEMSQSSNNHDSAIERKPESRHPAGPDVAPEGPKSGKKSKRNYISRSSNWC